MATTPRRQQSSQSARQIEQINNILGGSRTSEQRRKKPSILNRKSDAEQLSCEIESLLATQQMNKSSSQDGNEEDKSSKDDPSSAISPANLIPPTLSQSHDDRMVIENDEAGEQAYFRPRPKYKLLSYEQENVPILYSAMISHHTSGELDYETPPMVRQEALEMIQRALNAREIGHACGKVPLGRLSKEPRSEPTVVIDDVDLYLCRGMVYVATEQGLMLTADYLELIGVEVTKKVRFNGLIPPWAKAALAKRERRCVLQEYLPQGPGQLKLTTGEVVILCEQGNNGWALGLRANGGRLGWFPLNSTIPLCDEPQPIQQNMSWDFHKYGNEKSDYPLESEDEEDIAIYPQK